MERRTNSPYPRLDRPVLAIIGLLLVLSTVLFTKGDREHEWRYYQWDFKRLVTQKFGEAKMKTVPSGLQQIWVPSLGRADRCTTCHQAVRWAGFETADEPFRTHPKEPRATAGRDGRWTSNRRTVRWSTGRIPCSARRSARPTASWTTSAQ